MFTERPGKRRWLYGLLFVLTCLPWLGVRAEVLELRQAQWVDAPGGQQTLSLPFAWEVLQRGKAGSAQMSINWPLELSDSLEPRAMGLFIPKVGNAFELKVNGWVLLRQGELDRHDGADSGKLPQWVAVPQELLQTDNVIEVRLRADAGRRAGLSTVWAGPQDEVERLYQWRQWDRFGLTLVVMVLSWGVGMLAFAFSWAQRGLTHPQDVKNRFIFMVAGIAEVSWSLRMADQVWVEPPLPWPVWGVLSSLCYLVWIAGALVFCHHACELRLRWLKPGARIFVGVGLACALGSRWLGLPWIWTAWMASTAVGLLGYGAWFCVTLLHRPTALRVLVSLAALSNIAAGAWAWWVFRRNSDPMGAGSLQRYTSVLFTLVLLVILLQRFRAASIRARDNISWLDQKIAQKEHELAQIYLQQEQTAREQERQHERARIWRDLHDGLGAHLSSALRQLQAGPVDRPALVGTLQDSLLQLKLSVDVMNLPPGDLAVMLGSLRYRLAPRFEAAGLALDWQVEVLPRLAVLESPQALREVQFVVYEAFSNVLQHSGARRLRVQARAVQGGALLTIADDGGLWTSKSQPGRGLRFMDERAAALGASLNVTHDAAGTVVSLMIPGGTEIMPHGV